MNVARLIGARRRLEQLKYEAEVSGARRDQAPTERRWIARTRSGDMTFIIEREIALMA
jgi:hypothetical protein